MTQALARAEYLQLLCPPRGIAAKKRRRQDAPTSLLRLRETKTFKGPKGGFSR
jgi:hypothetical protein